MSPGKKEHHLQGDASLQASRLRMEVKWPVCCLFWPEKKHQVQWVRWSLDVAVPPPDPGDKNDGDGGEDGIREEGNEGDDHGGTVITRRAIFFRATPMAHGGSQARGRIRVTAAGLHHSHSHTGLEPCLGPTVQRRPGIEPTSSGILVAFVTAEPQRELLKLPF